MRRIIIINGSPKKNMSASAKLASEIITLLPGDDIQIVSALQLGHMHEARREQHDQHIASADVLLFIFPVYADALPASLQMIMSQISRTARSTPPAVYAIANCGFYESEHTRLALQIITHFCQRTGWCWQGGIGIGGGAMINPHKKLNAPRTRKIAMALRALAERISKPTHTPVIEFIEPPVPRWLYSIIGSLGWLPAARRNGVLSELIVSRWCKN